MASDALHKERLLVNFVPSKTIPIDNTYVCKVVIEIAKQACKEEVVSLLALNERTIHVGYCELYVPRATQTVSSSMTRFVVQYGYSYATDLIERFGRN